MPPEKELTTDNAVCAFQGSMFFQVYKKGKPHKYRIMISELYVKKKSYAHNTAVYVSTHPADMEHSTEFSVVNRSFRQAKNKIHTAYVSQWFSILKFFNHLWTCKKWM
jgi:hypothetical protein